MECQSLGQIEVSLDEFRNKSIFEFMEVLSSKVFADSTEIDEFVYWRKSSCFMGRYDDIHTEFVRAMGEATVFLIYELLKITTQTKFIFQYALLTDFWDYQIECVAL